MPESKPHTDTDDFVNIFTDADNTLGDPNTAFYDQWVDHSSGKQPIPAVIGANMLRKLYPKHSLVLTHGRGMTILGFPAAFVTPLETNQLVTNLAFVPLPRYAGVPGVLVDAVEHGAFNVSWNDYELIIYTVQYPTGFGNETQFYVLHKGPEDVSRLFLLSAGAWADSLHEEIWVFNQGFWYKSHPLWREVQKSDWKDVILKEEFKKAIQKDIYGFFASEVVYKELAIPWKRGLIMYGPPGNGKTISLKTIMKTCGDKGFAPLYVKSFQSWKGEEGAMADVFDKARQLAPCVVILEDLDSLINDHNRSFFLNQMDGLESNDGLLIIGTTNHFERLDPGLSSRPSRFDRKYKFDDPDEHERKLYVQYWQQKLANNKEIEFSDRLVVKVTRLTERFSFAYLKEAFVSSLVLFLAIEGEKPSFEGLLIDQIEILRKQLDKQLRVSHQHRNDVRSLEEDIRYDAYSYPDAPTRPPRPDSSKEYDVHALLDALSEAAPRTDPSRSKIYRTSADSNATFTDNNSRNFRNLLDNLSDSLSEGVSRRISRSGDSPPDQRAPQNSRQIRYQDIMENISAENSQFERLYGQINALKDNALNLPTSSVWPGQAEFSSATNQPTAGPSGYHLSSDSIWK